MEKERFQLGLGESWQESARYQHSARDQACQHLKSAGSFVQVAFSQWSSLHWIMAFVGLTFAAVFTPQPSMIQPDLVHNCANCSLQDLLL